MKSNERAIRILMCIFGNLFIGAGVAAFKFSLLGNDPFDGMNMALSDLLHIYYPLLQIMVNICFFIIEVTLGRDLIGLGTIINAIFLGYIVDFCGRILALIASTPDSMVLRILIMLAGLILTGLGLSLYQQSDLGVAPYDALAIIMDRKIKKLPYFFARIICDFGCALVCYFAGGIIGLGTIASAFGFGPVIAFFNKTLSNKLLSKYSKNQ
ncbi:MAG: hypothetical protein MJ103_09165 [Saccharofermentans sp.]|nr:hypothetical protein [Saccharofermentans sp.]